MIKKSLVLTLFVLAVLSAKAQYMKYDPIPYYPVPDLPLPQMRNYIPPPPMPIPSNGNPNSSQTIQAIFAIQDALINGRDVTTGYINAQAKIVFYAHDGNMNMSIFFLNNNSQSFGSIGPVKTDDTPASDSKYRKTVSTFRWTYKNSFDTNSGDANVTLSKVYKDNEITFSCQIITDDGKSFEFKGHMQR